MRPIVFALPVLLFTVKSALADTPPAKAAQGDLTCADGRTVHVALQNDAIAIETKYGKLLIPAADIERIDFTFRVPDDVAKKIDAALKRVGSEAFPERKAASKELLELGPRAYLALKAATKSDNPELARQAELLVTEIQSKVPAGSFKFPKTDRIQTADCVVSGRITSELKLIPGDSAVKLAEPLVFEAGGGATTRAEAGIEVGKAAPEIDGKDVDGKEIRLSDYRGKVVLLFFWGNWCPPCRAMYPQLKSLANNLAEERFVILGVNSDKDRDGVKKVLKDEKITWRSFWNDGSTGGPIAKAWNVQAWPTLYLIDHRGVIRERWMGSPGPERLTKAIEAAVKAASGKE